MDRKVFLTLVAALSVLPLPALLPEEASKVPESEINAALASPDSFLRHNTWKKLNPEDDGNYRTLVKVLKSLPWFDRDGAVIALAKAATESTLQKMVKALKDDKDPMVRQGMAMALAKMNDEKFYPRLYEALNDKSPVVRRIVVNALRVHKKKEAVSALVDAFQKEEDPVVRSFMVESLNQLTQAYQGPDPRAWFVWWEAAKADPEYELGKNDEIAQRKAEELGNKLKKRTTVSVSGEMTLETEERGRQTSKGMPIIVLPPYGFSKDIMTPFLSELEKTNKLFYVELPGREAFKNLPNVGNTNLPFFPLDQMVKAFEDLRKETKQERFALMACGLSCWIAMRYASLYPQSVSHLVFIAPFSSNKAVGDGYDRCSKQGQAKKDVELHHAAMSHSINTQTGQTEHDRYHEEKKIPKPEGEIGSLDRREWSLFFKDERDSLATILYPIKDSKKRMGFLYPDFKCFSEPRRNIPTIVIAGAASILTSQQDCDAIAKHYGGRLYMYPNSSCMPFAEESATFNKHMAALLRENQKSKKDSKDKTKKPKDGEEDSVPGSAGEPETAAGAKPEKGGK